MVTKASTLSLADIDVLAWKSICDWPSLANYDTNSFDPIYVHLTKWFLWDKVGRAVRMSYNPQFIDFELQQLNSAPKLSRIQLNKMFFFTKVFKQKINQFCLGFCSREDTCDTNELNLFRENGPLLYVPVLSERLAKTVCALNSDKTCRVVVRHNPIGIEGVNIYKPSFNLLPNYELSASIFSSIINSLKKFGITLIKQDASRLRAQIIELTVLVQRVEKELDLLQPDAILVHGDNHPPHQAYVLVGRDKGIDSIMLQHGLDCEHYYLDEAYATAIAVWGNGRLQRYHEKSSWQPSIRVTGNPEYDNLLKPERIDTEGNYWLWITRPHVPGKCYLPSRSPKEGLDILDAFMSALRGEPHLALIIKPHPYDYMDLYSRVINDNGLQGRISISDKAVQTLLPDASAVITEDSTAGMEAMFWGKPIIHAHFASSPPTMPFVEYKAALPGFSAEELVMSLGKVSKLTANDKIEMLKGQLSFLDTFAGPCDGQAEKRVVNWILEILSRRYAQ